MCLEERKSPVFGGERGEEAMLLLKNRQRKLVSPGRHWKPRDIFQNRGQGLLQGASR